jgi:hypothetical protein
VSDAPISDFCRPRPGVIAPGLAYPPPPRARAVRAIPMDAIPNDAHLCRECKLRPWKWMKMCWECERWWWEIHNGEPVHRGLLYFRDLGKGG